MRNLYSVFNGLGESLDPYLKQGAIYYSVNPDNTFRSEGTASEDMPVTVTNVGSTHTKFRFSAAPVYYYAANADIGNLPSSEYSYPTKRYSIGSGVRIRSSASKDADANIIGVLNKGDSVYSADTTVDGSGLKWRPVKYGGNKTGFVADQYLSKSKPVGVSTTTSPEQTTGASKDPTKATGVDEDEVEVSFLDKYRTPLMLTGAALVIGGIAYYIYSNRGEQSLAMAGAPKYKRRKRR
jgi:hypothetical protein